MELLRHECPACDKLCRRAESLTVHWRTKHEFELGNMAKHLTEMQCLPSECGDYSGTDGGGAAALATAQGGGLSTSDVEAAAKAVCDVAMEQVDVLKFRYFEGDASVQRSKSFAQSVCQVIKPILEKVIEPHVKAGVNVGELIGPIMGALDKINTVKRERAFRRGEDAAASIPPLHAYPRVLGVRRKTTGAATSRRALRKNTVDQAIIYETRLEEVSHQFQTRTRDASPGLELYRMAWRAGLEPKLERATGCEPLAPQP